MTSRRVAPLVRYPTAVLMTAVLTGCQVGPRLEDVTPANSPRGTETSIELESPYVGRVEGELVAVRETDLIVLTSQGFTAVSYDVFRNAKFSNVKGVGRWRNTAEKRAALARFSRYPFGLDEALLEALLEAHGQEGLRTIRPATDP
jgi:hypothetical protein